jgi:hypothetical protein
LCDANTFKRAAIIAALNDARFSLAVSGRIAFFLPSDADTDLPPRAEPPKADWFDPDKPAKAGPEHDLLIEIYNGCFVGIACGENHEFEPAIYGNLRNEGTRFVSWLPFREQFHIAYSTTDQISQALPHQIVKVIPKWESPAECLDQLDPNFLDYQYEGHSNDGDPLALAAEALREVQSSRRR